MVKEALLSINDAELVEDISQLIRDSKKRTFVAVNAEITLLYWHIGHRINQYIL